MGNNYIANIAYEVCKYPMFYNKFCENPKKACYDIMKENNIAKDVDDVLSLKVLKQIMIQDIGRIDELIESKNTPMVGSIVAYGSSHLYEVKDLKLSMEEIISGADITSNIIDSVEYNYSKLHFKLMDYIAAKAGVNRYNLSNVDKLVKIVRESFMYIKGSEARKDSNKFSDEDVDIISNFFYKNYLEDDKKTGNPIEDVKKEFIG